MSECHTVVVAGLMKISELIKKTEKMSDRDDVRLHEQAVELGLSWLI